MSNKVIETWISTGGKYCILVLSESDEQVFKIVTNDRDQRHVDAPKVYDSLQEAMKRVEAIEDGVEDLGA